MNKKNIITTAALCAILAAAAIAIFVTGQDRFSGDFFSALLYFFIGAAFWYLVHNVLHESFHAAFCAAFYGKITSVAFLGFSFNFYNGFKVRLALKSGYSGWTEFICKRPEKADVTLRAGLWGGLTGSLLTLTAIAAAYFLSAGFFAHYFVLSGIIPVVYMIAVNFAIKTADQDGALLSFSPKGKRAFAMAAARLETESYLSQGKLLTNAYPVRMRAAYAFAREENGYDYLAALEKGDIKRAADILRAIESSGESANNGVIDVFNEKLFLSCVEKKDGAKQDLEKFSPEIFGDDPDSLRAHYHYRKARGERAWSELLEKSYFKSCENVYLKGLKESYVEIGARWIRGL